MAIIEASISNFAGQTFIGSGSDTLKLIGGGLYRFDKVTISGFAEITTSDDVTIAINASQLAQIRVFSSTIFNSRSIYIFGQNIDLGNIFSFGSFGSIYIENDNATVITRNVDQALKVNSYFAQNDTIIVRDTLSIENRNKLHNRGFDIVTDNVGSSVNTTPTIKNLDQQKIKVAIGQTGLIDPQGDAFIADDDTTISKLIIHINTHPSEVTNELVFGTNFRIDGTNYGASFYYKEERIGLISSSADGLEIGFYNAIHHSVIQEFIRTLSYKPSEYTNIYRESILKITIKDPGGRSSTASIYLGSTDPIHSTTGNYIKQGTVGADKFFGRSDNEIFFPGNGKDVILTGSGKDIIVFNSHPTNGNRDHITDFSVKNDTIWLDNAVFKKLGSKGSELSPIKLNKKFFTIGKAAKDKNDYIVFDKTTGLLTYDKDGIGPSKATVIAKLPKNIKLTYNEFYVI